jgi:myo-inositol 2-dehydrogenase/D-chiro-inositol 1-dehydrogenase/scyllo-inositol 2-dehydrogenase (NAD+)
MNDKIRVCLIGCGRAGLIHAKSYAGPVDGAELIAVCDADENNVEAAQRIANVRYFYTDYREALKYEEGAAGDGLLRRMMYLYGRQ